MKITINGQLTLMMLYEMIMERIPNATALMQNTDGIETVIPRKHVDEYMEICKEWEEITNLNLEHDQYEKLILGDVNNYIGVFGYKETDMNTWRDIKKKNPHYLFKIKDGDSTFIIYSSIRISLSLLLRRLYSITLYMAFFPRII
jgi:hypothetical protein